MSTSFPNSNGSVPQYNPQANGSFNQYAQNGPPGGYPGMEHYQHNMYAPNANGYGGMPPGQPNMGGPAQPTAMPLKGQPPQQYPGPPGAGVKLPGYDANSMQNGYMGYPPHQQRTTGHPPQNGPPPNYNAHQQMPPPNNPYGGVPDPYRMYSGMQGPPAQPPQNSSTQPAPPAQNANYPPPAQPAPPSAQAVPHQYPTQQPLPAHLHGGPPYQSMPPPQSAPLQHYQPPGYTNGTTPTRPPTTQGFPPLQSSKQAKQDDTRPNNLQQTPNQQYPGSFGGPGAPNGYDAYAGGPGGYPGYPPPGNQGTPVTSQAPGQNGTSGTPNGQHQFSGFNASLYSTPGPDTGGHHTPSHNTSGQNTPGHHTPSQMTPTHQTPGHQTPGHQSSGHNTPAQNTPSGSAAPVVNPYAPMGNQGQFGSNDPASSHGTPGNYGGMNSSHSTPNPPTGRATPGTPSTPTTPGASQQRTPQQQQQQQQPGMQNHMPPPPQYNHNPMASPNHGPNGTTPQKHQTPMGSSLPPLNGQYPPMTQNMQSPVTTPAPEPTFKEPAMPVRHSPSHTQSPAHQQPTGAPPAYHTPSSLNRTPEATTSSQPARSPTFAVPTLPAAKPKTSPQKKRGEIESVPEPPSQDTPFTLVHNFELPAAMTNLKESISKMHPQVDKHYFSRKRQPLRHPYPEGANAHNTPATEPSTFGFIEGSKYFKEGYNRKITLQTPSMGPPTLSRSQSMLVSPGFNASQPSTSGRQPAKKARSASDASEPTFTMPLPPNRHPMAATDPRMQQQMQMHQYHQQMHMQKMHQQQIAAQQQHMTRMNQAGNMPSTSTAGGMPPAPGPTALPPIAPPALQRAESMPQLPSQQQPPMGGQMPPHMAGMPPMNGNHLENPTANSNTGHTNNQQRVGLPPLTLRNPALAGTQSHDFPSAPSTSNQPPDQCAGCHNFISAGSPTLCCMYHDCKNVYHRQCTRLTSNAFNHFDGTPQARWVCPPCETQVRPMQMQHA
ncbi:CRE-NRA-3 protein [Caenorhabditis remanei]|uniref:CRE-NRA-3 protein n=1 Tax=Caenorhabditis remanei TaxID=31234 RepID=E3MMD6_CAERE|nr:CRE-NRA-3 protein [Caenorhabditis remanei]